MKTKLLSDAELDQQVAEQVMGWKWKAGQANISSVQHYAGSDWQCNSYIDFQPSTDTPAAMRVVKKLDLLGWQIVMINCSGCKGKRAKGWAVDVVSDDVGAIGVHADTLERAICRAALQAFDLMDKETA